MFNLMYELAELLRDRRFKHGSIDFDFPESKIILDEKGKPLEIKEYEHNNAHRIIEEFMLAANQTVAEEYFWQELPFVYRVHENPDSEKITQLGVFINNFGYPIKMGADESIHPKEIQKLINSVKGKPEEALISRLALRSMKQARYTTTCEGHFGLAMKYYCHFTSPIRRYPDLQIHRIIKENIHGKMNEKRIEHYNQILPVVTEEASRLERRADDAEREVEKMKKAEYMEQFVGQSFDGVISGVTTWGMYVELPNTVEGMVRVADIPGDYYYFEEETYSMVGEHTGRRYKLGEPIKITVSAVDKITRTIDFVLADEDSDSGENDIEQTELNKNLTDKKKKKNKKNDKKVSDKNTAMSVEELRAKAEMALEQIVSAKKAAEMVADEAKKLTSAAKKKKAKSDKKKDSSKKSKAKKKKSDKKKVSKAKSSSKKSGSKKS